MQLGVSSPVIVSPLKELHTWFIWLSIVVAFYQFEICLIHVLAISFFCLMQSCAKRSFLPQLCCKRDWNAAIRRRQCFGLDTDVHFWKTACIQSNISKTTCIQSNMKSTCIQSSISKTTCIQSSMKSTCIQYFKDNVKTAAARPLCRASNASKEEREGWRPTLTICSLFESHTYR